LIHQSILYEGNPDRTNIRERFLYSHEDPKPQSSAAEIAGSRTAEPKQTPAELIQGQEGPSIAPGHTPVDEGASMHDDAQIQTNPTTASPVTNGLKEEGHPAEGVGRDADTEMGGTA
jgi:hypothetical protein